VKNKFKKNKKIVILIVSVILCVMYNGINAQTRYSNKTVVNNANDVLLTSNCSGCYALTFDDGPNSNTSNLVKILNKAGVKATFFVIGKNISGYQSAFQAMLNSGMKIENHSYSHQHMTSWSYQQVYDDLQKTQQAIQNAGGDKPTLFRPPYLEVNSTIRSVAKDLGLTIVTCDVDVKDWNNATTSEIITKAKNIQNGGVFLMHDGYITTNSAVPIIVSNLNSRSLCAGSINQSGTAVEWSSSNENED